VTISERDIGSSRDQMLNNKIVSGIWGTAGTRERERAEKVRRELESRSSPAAR
jgi:hypothetical protein